MLLLSSCAAAGVDEWGARVGCFTMENPGEREREKEQVEPDETRAGSNSQIDSSTENFYG